MPNPYRLILDKLLGKFQNKELIAYVEDEVRWIDRDNKIEKITTLLFQDQYSRRYIKIINYGYCKWHGIKPQSIGEIKIWQHGGDLPTKAKTHIT